MSASDSTRPTARAKPERVEPGIYRGEGRRGYRVYVSEGGKGRWVVVPTLDKARAVRRKVQAERDLARAKGERVAPPERRTLAEAVEALLATARVSDATRDLYRHDLARPELRPMLRRKLTDVTVDDVARLVRELETTGNRRTGGKLAPATVRNVLTALSATFTLAVRRGWTPSNPVSGLGKGERPSAKRTRPIRPLGSEEIARVVEAAGDRWRVLVTLAVFSGLRQSELLGLSWRDVDLDGGRLTVRCQLRRGSHALVATKTDDGRREVPLPAFLVRMLREHRLASRWSLDEHPVFASDVGGRLDHRNVGRAWSRIRAGAKLAEPLPVFHDLRHTAASLWIAEGLDMVYVSRVLGHSSPTITLDVYAHLFDRARHEERATAALDAAFAGVLRS